VKSIVVHRLISVGAATVIAGVTVATFATAAFGVTGTALITDTTAARNQITTPGQAPTAAFTFTLPGGALCAHDGTAGEVVSSFVVPLGTSPASLVFSSGFANTGFWLADATGTPWAGAGPQNGSALISPITVNFEWAGLTGFGVPVSGTGGLIDPAQASPGKWLVGVACTFSAGAVDNYYDVEVDFTAAGNSYTWQVPGQLPNQAPEAPLAIALPIGGAAVLAGVVYVQRRRRRHTATALAA
jgi:hypothetical protein